MPEYDLNLINAKYHLSVAKNLLTGFQNNETKRFVTATIKELARATSNLIRAILVAEKKPATGSKKSLKHFMKDVAPRYLEEGCTQNLELILEIRSNQAMSRVELLKRDRIIFLIKGSYKTLEVSRLGEFANSVDSAIKSFQKKFRQV
jgi:hypothetical protein